MDRITLLNDLEENGDGAWITPSEQSGNALKPSWIVIPQAPIPVTPRGRKIA